MIKKDLLKDLLKKLVRVLDKAMPWVLCVLIILIFVLVSYLDIPRRRLYGDTGVEYLKAVHLVHKEASEFAGLHKGESDQEIEHAIQTYMAENYKYDMNIGNPQYTNTYDGLSDARTMVCRGYAVIAFELWRACGYDAEIVVGFKGKNQYHAWVKVDLSGNAQNLDYSVLGQGREAPSDPLEEDYAEICTYDHEVFSNIFADWKYSEFIHRIKKL